VVGVGLGVCPTGVTLGVGLGVGVGGFGADGTSTVTTKQTAWFAGNVTSLVAVNVTVVFPAKLGPATTFQVVLENSPRNHFTVAARYCDGAVNVKVGGDEVDSVLDSVMQR
jgi:hypothetical protein